MTTRQQYHNILGPTWDTPHRHSQLKIVDHFIKQLEKHINNYHLSNGKEDYFFIRKNDQFDFTPLGITQEKLANFCQEIIYTQSNLNITLSNYLKALENFSLLEKVNNTDATNAYFIIDMYMSNPSHLDILANDPEELAYNPQTPDKLITLITDPLGLYYNLLNLSSDKEESDSYSPEEYTYDDL